MVDVVGTCARRRVLRHLVVKALVAVANVIHVQVSAIVQLLVAVAELVHEQVSAIVQLCMTMAAIVHVQLLWHLLLPHRHLSCWPDNDGVARGLERLQGNRLLHEANTVGTSIYTMQLVVYLGQNSPLGMDT